jgi:hypothetical protein
MPGLVPGTHVLLAAKQGMGGRAAPGTKCPGAAMTTPRDCAPALARPYFGANSWFGKLDVSGTLMTTNWLPVVVWQALQPAVILP